MRFDVMTVGTFDMPHYGHLKLFSVCKKIAGEGRVIVGVNSDEFVAQFKNKIPAYPFDTRHAIIRELKTVDTTFKNEGTLANALSRWRPNFLVVGSDWAKKDYYAQIGVDQDWLDRNGITLLYTPYTEGISSTELRERILKVV